MLAALGQANVDGPRQLLLTAEDVNGNITPNDAAIVQVLTITLATQGTRVTAVDVNEVDSGFNLFNPKSENAPGAQSDAAGVFAGD